MKSLSVTIQMKAIEQYFSVVLFIILCKGVTFSDNKRWINIVAKKMQMQSIERDFVHMEHLYFMVIF